LLGILSPLQIAKSIVCSYPFFPDVVAVLNACKSLEEASNAAAHAAAVAAPPAQREVS
jgi:hypothetical protein